VSDTSPVATRRPARLLGELALITAGVLLALTADAAWDSRQERARERDYLQSLRTEMLAARAEFDGDVATRESHLAILDSLSGELRQRKAADSTVVTWLRAANTLSSVFFPPTAVFDDLVSSGNLRLIRSDGLRFALMEYAQHSPRLRFAEGREQTLIENQLLPLVVGSIDLTRRDPEAEELDALFSSSTFRSLLAERRERLAAIMFWGRPVEESLDRVIEMLEAELGTAS
jgi:uncharacterized membrane protein YidH (DUF202 family)